MQNSKFSAGRSWLFVFRDILRYIIRLNFFSQQKWEAKCFGRNRRWVTIRFMVGSKLGTAWKVSKYRVISGSYFPVFTPSTGKYEPEITPYFNTFHVVLHSSHSHQSIKDVRRTSRTVSVLEHPLIEGKRLFWLDSFIYERKERSSLPEDESSQYEIIGNTEPLERRCSDRVCSWSNFCDIKHTSCPCKRVSMAANISTTSELPKYTPPNNKTKSKNEGKIEGISNNFWHLRKIVRNFERNSSQRRCKRHFWYICCKWATAFWCKQTKFWQDRNYEHIKPLSNKSVLRQLIMTIFCQHTTTLFKQYEWPCSYTTISFLDGKSHRFLKVPCKKSI